MLNRLKLKSDRIFNADETGITTVMQPNTIAKHDEKQVSQITSGERDQLVTLLAFVNAVGNALPPVFVFPCVNFKDFMLHGAPPQSLGLANKSGWMTGENLFSEMQHFAKYGTCSKENPVLGLLLIDNHESHTTIDTLIH